MYYNLQHLPTFKSILAQHIVLCQAVNMYHNLLTGRRDIISVLLPTREKPSTGEEKFESVPVTPSLKAAQSQQHQFTSTSGKLCSLSSN